ncbi:MAG: hypothetical protein ACJ71Y_11675 [Blastococcus sp.]
MPHTFEDLMQLEQAAVDAHNALATADNPAAARQAAVDTAAAFQAAVTLHAAEKGESRVEVEMAVKRAVRHPETAEG